MTNEEVLKQVSKNKDEAMSIFNDYYSQKAREEGEEMMYDDRFYGEDSDEYEGQEEELYEQFSHCCGHSASYEGARGVIMAYGDEENYDDEELQLEIMDLLDVSPY